MSQLRFRSQSSTLVTTPDAWDEVLTLAEGFGWCPEQLRTLYRADVGLEVSAADSANLVQALEALAKHISEEEPELGEIRRTRILRDLSSLIDFCRGGQFRIC